MPEIKRKIRWEMDFPEINQQGLQMDVFDRCILEDEPTIILKSLNFDEDL